MLLLLWLIGIGVSFALLRNSELMVGMAGGRLAVIALALLCLWGIFQGSLPQVIRGESAPIYQRILTAPPFIFALLLLLSNLAWGILKHLSGGLRASSMFLFNHIGVLIVGAAGLFGVGDLLRVDLWAQEGQLAWTASDGKHQYELPFAVDLHAFKREFFPPQLTVLDAASGEVILPDDQDLLDLKAGFTGPFFGHELEVKEVTQSAPWSMEGDPIPAAYVIAKSPDGQTSEGWISCGSHLMPPVFLGMGTIAFVMPEPRVRLYESHITVVTPEGEPFTTHLRVNHPVKFNGWWLYQKGYRIDGGPGARFSQIEVIRDPWLIPVYVGFALLGIGSLLGVARAGGLLRAAAQLPKDPS
jgi:hypothetical protein